MFKIFVADVVFSWSIAQGSGCTSCKWLFVFCRPHNLLKNCPDHWFSNLNTVHVYSLHELVQVNAADDLLLHIHSFAVIVNILHFGEIAWLATDVSHDRICHYFCDLPAANVVLILFVRNHSSQLWFHWVALVVP